jgi:ABC-type antimicrobial peptide transport system permease subunit
LAAVAAFSCALVIGITCALNAVTKTIEGHVTATVGTADVRIRSATSEKLFDASLLAQVKQWPEVLHAGGRAQTAISFSMDRELLRGQGGEFQRRPRRFSANAQANASTQGSEGVELIAGRHVEGVGEIVIDSLLAEALSFRGLSVEDREDGLPEMLTLNPARDILSGQAPEMPETVASAMEARRLNALVGVRLGDEVTVVRQAFPHISVSAILSNPRRAMRLVGAMGNSFQMPGLKALTQKPMTLKVVGVSPSPPLTGRPHCFMTLETLNAIMGAEGSRGVDQIDIVLKSGTDPARFASARAAELGEGYIVQTSSKVTAGLDKNIEASRLGVLLATIMGFLASSFIIMTGMTTGVSEKQRELGMLRSIGASRGQLAMTQLVGGAVIGVLGALVGLPLGLAMSWGLVEIIKMHLDVSFSIAWEFVAVAIGGAMLSGVLGAAYPAWRAARISPLEALTVRAREPRPAHLARVGVAALVMVLVPLGIVTLVPDHQMMFWLYASIGVPLLFAGYFLLAVPLTALVAWGLGGWVSRLLGLPPRLLSRAVLSTPYRHGFTAGSLMAGLALMVGIWTQGGAVRRDWLGNIQFPDAFVTGLNLTPESRVVLESLPFVEATTAIAIKPVDVDMFGVQALQKYKTSFMAFEPRSFFAMSKLQWVEGDQEEATRRLEAGGAVIVAREFQVARGLGLGDTFVCKSDGVEHTFDIVGVVTSPGLEMVSKFFNVGEDFTDQALHAVFGSRKDLKEKLNSESIHLLQIDLRDDVDDAHAVKIIRERLAGAGILDVGSGRRIKGMIMGYAQGALTGLSLIGVAAMLVASLGVANLIVAGIHSRQYEFGVLRALGAGPGLVGRLVLGEAVIIALAAVIVGTVMGLQGALGGKRIDESLFGIKVGFEVPWRQLWQGWGMVLVVSLLAAGPAALMIARRRPRELLASMKGA